MDDVRERLERERAATARRLRELGVAVPADEALRPGAAAAVFEETEHIVLSRERELGMLNRERLSGRLEQLLAAIARVDAGTYGLCVECGEPISRARLQAIPEAAACRDCQEQIERGGAAR